jgi:lipopolysaccharide/colanic/teichoic acid biosynthesis glycosyltransferase
MITLDQELTGQFSMKRAGNARRKFYETSKRVLDIALSAIGLIVLSPLLVGVAIAIYAHDRGPIFFAQTRVGKGGRLFKFWKFRSMEVNAEALKAALAKQNQHSDGRTFKMKKDPRITPVGRFIRRFSIDELPQIYNIFIGDMSIVGPRPPVPQEVAQYTARDMRRLAVVPGLTCIWQVSGRSELDFKKQVELDITYIKERSFLFDMSLIARTVPAVLSGRGAY